MRVTYHEPDTGYMISGSTRTSGKAWTPNEFTATAPDEDMVRVLFDDHTEARWEYKANLRKEVRA
ncbi:Uncharacterised protein [Mycobacteroides abscessus subsp. abscessus]|uniref:hypothetical protein n=1 Tax=Mycobacteroides abscessus TaxID=36809 RepID=UPI0009A7A345|nr:hypothetical protein [Mycobacteroides abscessus]SLI00910.1 Uncharacterised protein [Mycobacteroides abscessus subsp. abscessus]